MSGLLPLLELLLLLGVPLDELLRLPLVYVTVSWACGLLLDGQLGRRDVHRYADFRE